MALERYCTDCKERQTHSATSDGLVCDECSAILGPNNVYLPTG